MVPGLTDKFPMSSTGGSKEGLLLETGLGVIEENPGFSSPKFSSMLSSSSSCSDRSDVGDQRPMDGLCPNVVVLAGAKDVMPLPTVIPPVLTPNDNLLLVAGVLGLTFRSPLRATLADEPRLELPSFHEKLLRADENDR